MSDDQPSIQNLEQIAERALQFQRYIFRKAWGTYYAVWAAAYTVFVFGWMVPSVLGLPLAGYWSWLYFALSYVGVGWLAGFATMLIFRKARRILLLRKALDPNRYAGFRKIWIWWLGFYAIVLLSFTYIPNMGLPILYALLFSVDIFIYYTLKFSFQNRFPLEGWLGLLSFGACIVFSFFAALSSPNYAAIGIAWGILIAVWLFCAIYALWRSSDELVALVY